MSDQFSKVMRTGVVERITDTSSTVTPLLKISGKKVERRRGTTAEQTALPHAHQHYSEIRVPNSELWDMVIGAVGQFNERQDLRNSPYAVRIWAQNAGFRVQLIHEHTGELIKQSRLIPFKDLSGDELNDIVNSLIRERGVVIDIMR